MASWSIISPNSLKRLLIEQIYPPCRCYIFVPPSRHAIDLTCIHITAALPLLWKVLYASNRYNLTGSKVLTSLRVSGWSCSSRTLPSGPNGPASLRHSKLQEQSNTRPVEIQVNKAVSHLRSICVFALHCNSMA
jgi:hypothetical protein